MKFISGKKLSMTQIWVGDKVMAVTQILAGPCTITQIKTKDNDGYQALQLAFGSRKAKNINKPQLGHYKKAGVQPTYVREFRTDNVADFKIGDVVSVETFAVGDQINVTGTSKGRGFQGVIKRHHFHGFKKTHGNKDQERMPGSIGAKGPAHVFKGMKMGGRMGGERVTTTNLEVMGVDVEKNIIFVKGAVPGSINGFVFIQGKGDLQVNLRKVEDKSEEIENKETKEVKTEEDKENKENKSEKLESKETEKKISPEEASKELKELRSEEIKDKEVEDKSEEIENKEVEDKSEEIKNKETKEVKVEEDKENKENKSEKA